MTKFDIPAWDKNDLGDNSCADFAKFNGIKKGKNSKLNRVKKEGGILKAKIDNNVKNVKKAAKNMLAGQKTEQDFFKKIDEKLKLVVKNTPGKKTNKSPKNKAQKSITSLKKNVLKNGKKQIAKTKNPAKNILRQNEKKVNNKKQTTNGAAQSENEIRKLEISADKKNKRLKKKLKQLENQTQAAKNKLSVLMQKNSNPKSDKKRLLNSAEKSGNDEVNSTVNKKLNKKLLMKQKNLAKKLLNNKSKSEKKALSKQKRKLKEEPVQPVKSIDPKIQKFKRKLLEVLDNDDVKTKAKKPVGKPVYRPMTLREKMMQKLKGARFRLLNEQIYTTESTEAKELFEQDPEAFRAYHEGYRQQVSKWPLNPLDKIIENVKKIPINHVIADFGCGDAKLAESVRQKVHSFDLVAVNDKVTACDMANVPLASNSVDVAVFCLSLMGTNLRDYLIEANRVLKIGGILKIAEVESRFDKVEAFIDAVQKFHFKNTWKDLSHNLFYFIDFKKEMNIKKKHKMPTLSLKPCLYKKR